MKKIYLLALSATVSLAAFSQVKWGVQAIGNLSSANIPGLEADEDGTVKKKSVFGFGAGLSAEVPLGREFTLRPSFNFLKKGGGFDANFTDPLFGSKEDVKFRTNLFYAELPIHLALNGSLKSVKYFVGFGPSFGFGLAGKARVDYTYQDPGQPVETESEEIDAFDSNNDEEGFKRFEVSASVIGGIQWNNGFYVNAGYLAGMTNLFLEEAESSYKHNGLQLTIGYFFSKKK